MKLNYKFWYIKRDDDGFITEAAIRYYEGDFADIVVKDDDGNNVIVNKFVREKRLKRNDVKKLAKKGVYENGDKEAFIYTEEDFGRIKTDDELRSFLDENCKKDSREHVK